MLFRNLGRSGLKVAALCLGGNVFGWTADERASFAVLDTYAEGGGNFIDTANSYPRWAPGHSGGEWETIIGRWMRERGNRDKMIIATKVGGSMGDGPNQHGLSRQHIMHEVEASLRYLQSGDGSGYRLARMRRYQCIGPICSLPHSELYRDQ